MRHEPWSPTACAAFHNWHEATMALRPVLRGEQTFRQLLSTSQFDTMRTFEAQAGVAPMTRFVGPDILHASNLIAAAAQRLVTALDGWTCSP